MVYDSLPGDSLFATVFMDRNVCDIHLEDRSIDLEDGTEISILRSTFGQPKTDHPVPELLVDNNTKERKFYDKVRVAKQVLCNHTTRLRFPRYRSE